MTTKFKPLLILVSGIFFMQSCGDDDKSPAADVLVTSNRQTGVFYKLDQETGDTTRIFTPTISGNTLTNLRAFVYHKGEDALFASSNSSILSQGGGDVKADNEAGIANPGGFLYKINAKTKVATMINDNEERGWAGIANWAVAQDDSLVAVGYFYDAGNSGITKFGIDGGRSSKTIEVDICCGNGMLYDKETNSMLVASASDTDDGEVAILSINSTGDITGTQIINTFNNFPQDLSATWLNMKALAVNKKGVVYGLLFHNDLGITYLVTVDLVAEEITFVKKLGDDYDSQFNALAFIPAKYAK